MLLLPCRGGDCRNSKRTGRSHVHFGFLVDRDKCRPVRLAAFSANTKGLNHAPLSPSCITDGDWLPCTSNSEEPTHPLPDGIAGAPRSNVRQEIPSKIAKPEVARLQRRQSYPTSLAAGGRRIRSELDEVTMSFIHDAVRRDWSEMLQRPRLICFGNGQAVQSVVPGG